MNNKVLMVALFGPDGSGKSTTADLLEEKLLENGLQVYRYHWRPRVLPSLKKDYTTFSFNDPSGLKTRSYFVSFACYLYFFLDFFVACTFTLKKLAENDTVIIYERYYFDVLIHAERYRLRKISWLGSLLSHLLPKPSLTYVFSGSPEVIHSRKPELSICEIRRQLALFKSELPKYTQVCMLDIEINSAAQLASSIAKEISER